MDLAPDYSPHYRSFTEMSEQDQIVTRAVCETVMELWKDPSSCAPLELIDKNELLKEAVEYIRHFTQSYIIFTDRERLKPYASYSVPPEIGREAFRSYCQLISDEPISEKAESAAKQLRFRRQQESGADSIRTARTMTKQTQVEAQKYFPVLWEIAQGWHVKCTRPDAEDFILESLEKINAMETPRSGPSPWTCLLDYMHEERIDFKSSRSELDRQTPAKLYVTPVRSGMSPDQVRQWMHRWTAIFDRLLIRFAPLATLAELLSDPTPPSEPA